MLHFYSEAIKLGRTLSDHSLYTRRLKRENGESTRIISVQPDFVTGESSFVTESDSSTRETDDSARTEKQRFEKRLSKIEARGKNKYASSNEWARETM